MNAQPFISELSSKGLLAAGSFVASPSNLGKWVFVGSLLLLLLWLIFLPKDLIQRDDDRKVVWWKNVRLWAIVICAVQIWIYWQFA